MEKGNLLVCKHTGENNKVKYFLMRVAALSKNTIQGYLARDYHVATRRLAIEVVPKDVVINLGSSPAPGSVYGVDVSYVMGAKEHPMLGKLHFFYKPNKETGESFMKAVDMFCRILKKNRLEFALDGPLLWEVHGSKGKHAGSYARSKKPDVMPHRLKFMPEAWSKSDYPRLLCHELAHHLHFEYMDNPHLNAAWVKLFNTTIKPNAISKEKSVELLNGMMAHDGPPSSFGSTLSDDDKNAFKWILRTLRAYRSISPKELDLLMESGGEDDIRELWPKRNIPLRELAPVVSEYATKNYKELIAESISFYLVGATLPKNVTTLVEKSLSYARKTRGGA